jgi:hypothetical protein
MQWIDWQSREFTAQTNTARQQENNNIRPLDIERMRQAQRLREEESNVVYKCHLI